MATMVMRRTVALLTATMARTISWMVSLSARARGITRASTTMPGRATIRGRTSIATTDAGLTEMIGFAIGTASATATTDSAGAIVTIAASAEMATTMAGTTAEGN